MKFVNNVYFVEKSRTKFLISRLHLSFRQVQQLQWGMNKKDMMPSVLLCFVKTRYILLEQDIYFLKK